MILIPRKRVRVVATNAGTRCIRGGGWYSLEERMASLCRMVDSERTREHALGLRIALRKRVP